MTKRNNHIRTAISEVLKHAKGVYTYEDFIDDVTMFLPGHSKCGMQISKVEMAVILREFPSVGRMRERNVSYIVVGCGGRYNEYSTKVEKQ